MEKQPFKTHLPLPIWNCCTLLSHHACLLGLPPGFESTYSLFNLCLAVPCMLWMLTSAKLDPGSPLAAGITGPGRILGIIGQYPSVSKSNRLYVDIFRFFFVKWRHNIPYFLIRRLSFMKSWTLWISNVGDTSENVVGLLYDECVQCLVYGCQVVGMVMMKCI
jgi:hypothetical protein